MGWCGLGCLLVGFGFGFEWFALLVVCSFGYDLFFVTVCYCCVGLGYVYFGVGFDFVVSFVCLFCLGIKLVGLGWVEWVLGCVCGLFCVLCLWVWGWDLCFSLICSGCGVCCGVSWVFVRWVGLV